MPNLRLQKWSLSLIWLQMAEDAHWRFQNEVEATIIILARNRFVDLSGQETMSYEDYKYIRMHQVLSNVFVIFVRHGLLATQVHKSVLRQNDNCRFNLIPH